MKAESEELLSLLVDGEEVDPDALAAALAEPGATDLLVQYACVHRAVRNPDAQPGDAFYEKLRRRLDTAPPRGIRLEADGTARGPRGIRLQADWTWRAPLAAAAMILLSLTGGVWLGWSMLPARAVPVPVVMRTPAAPRETAGAATPFRIVAPANCPAPGPPKPDRIVQFVPRGASRPGAPAEGNRP